LLPNFEKTTLNTLKRVQLALVMAEETLFTKILSGEVPGNFVGRGENWGAFLDVFPRSEGHTLVVPKKQVQRITDLSVQELSDLWAGVTKVQKILSAFFKTNDFTVVVHDGPLAGQEIPHVHIHVIPRTEGDSGRSLPAMFPDSKPQNPPDFEGLALLCENIKAALK
tara:strand:- start:364 stop:864 length:501 start_codon:yes stop_codon:yes gene_type:complete